MKRIWKGEGGGGIGNLPVFRLIAIVLTTACILAVGHFGGDMVPLLSAVEVRLVLALAIILILFVIIDAL